MSPSTKFDLRDKPSPQISHHPTLVVFFLNNTVCYFLAYTIRDCHYTRYQHHLPPLMCKCHTTLNKLIKHLGF